MAKARPNKNDLRAKIYHRIGEARLTTAVMETFELEAKINNRPQAIYTTEAIIERSTSLIAHMMVYLYDCGHNFELAFDTARKQLAHELFGFEAPAVAEFKNGKRVDSHVNDKTRKRVVREGVENPMLDQHIQLVEKDAVNPDKRLIVLADKSGRILN